ncbi:hypothetical protein B0E46_15650 [Rhodanobacter sp. B04]|nr:hypothetical protein B0E46_15650 [Rhodanobacter sp. B04]
MKITVPSTNLLAKLDGRTHQSLELTEAAELLKPLTKLQPLFQIVHLVNQLSQQFSALLWLARRTIGGGEHLPGIGR